MGGFCGVDPQSRFFGRGNSAFVGIFIGGSIAMATMNAALREDASTCGLHYLKRIVGKAQFESLDFSKASIDVINELIPSRKSGGALDPPLSYRTSAQRIRDWHRLGKAAQEQEATQLVSQEKDTKPPPTRRG